MKSQSRTKGVIIAYVATVARTLSRLLLTPLCLHILGLEEYGFYQYVFSVAAYATILDFGISSVVNKFTIEYREKNDSDGVENVMFYTLLFSIGAALIILIAGGIITINAADVFGKAASDRIPLVRLLLALMIAELIMLMFQHFFEGIILSAERYVTLRTVTLVQIILRLLLTVAMLYSNFGVLSIAIADLVGVGLCLSYEIYYAVKKIGIKIKYHFYDSKLITGMAKLSLALCLQSVVSYLNSSIDKYVLGRMLNTAVVSIYTVALTFSSFFDEIPTVIQRLYLPQAIKMVASGADGEKLTDFVIRPGRYQFMLCGGILGAFILFGKHFIILWSGKNTTTAWAVALMLMVPSVIPLVQNVCLSILTAMNKRLFRSYVMCGIAVVNLLGTILLVPEFGLLGAAMATALSLLVGNNIIMNIYYRHAIGINVKRLLGSICKGILPCALSATILCVPLVLLERQGVPYFLLECSIFCIVYFCLLYKFGMNAEEKRAINKSVRRIVKRRKD